MQKCEHLKPYVGVGQFPEINSLRNQICNLFQTKQHAKGNLIILFLLENSIRQPKHDIWHLQKKYIKIQTFTNINIYIYLHQASRKGA